MASPAKLAGQPTAPQAPQESQNTPRTNYKIFFHRYHPKSSFSNSGPLKPLIQASDWLPEPPKNRSSNNDLKKNLFFPIFDLSQRFRSKIPTLMAIFEKIEIFSPMSHFEIFLKNYVVNYIGHFYFSLKLHL